MFWKSVNWPEGPPPEETPLLVTADFGDIKDTFGGFWHDGEKWYNGGGIPMNWDITHWMLMPPPAGMEYKEQLRKIKKGAIYSGKGFGKWISVSEALPPLDEWVYIALQLKYKEETEWEYGVDAATMTDEGYGYIDGCWDTINDWDEGQEIHVTHWMPFPKQPMHPYEMPAPAEDEED